MKQQEHVIFREVQRSPIWVWILILGIAILMWYGFIQQIILDTPFGDKPAPNGVLVVLWLFFGIVFPVLMLGVLKLIIRSVKKVFMFVLFLFIFNISSTFSKIYITMNALLIVH
ncbi:MULTISPECIES: DUF6141 family protein [Bacillus cereus group]|uniref:DUF6141 family protein n=1 Tax=Bacillus cereus group TaxID=86661 RepID=UPI001F5B9A25|nr:DUF6141 family protein [Bacillus cereus group sp. N8]